MSISYSIYFENEVTITYQKQKIKKKESQILIGATSGRRRAVNKLYVKINLKQVAVFLIDFFLVFKRFSLNFYFLDSCRFITFM